MALLISGGHNELRRLRVEGQVGDALARDLGHIALLQPQLLQLHMRQALSFLAAALFAAAFLEDFQEGCV